MHGVRFEVTTPVLEEKIQCLLNGHRYQIKVWYHLFELETRVLFDILISLAIWKRNLRSTHENRTRGTS